MTDKEKLKALEKLRDDENYYGDFINVSNNKRFL